MAIKNKPKSNPAKLSTYRHESTNAEGKKIRGEIKALTVNLAKANLRQQGLHPITVERQKEPFVLGDRRPNGRRRLRRRAPGGRCARCGSGWGRLRPGRSSQ